jgi:hypothetical protein
MLSYGISKLTLSQFGVHDTTILEQPIKDIDSFYVTWHLFGRSPFFNIATGLLEIIGGVLLIFNRTVLIGALLVLTILGQILIIDIAFTTVIHGPMLSLRIGGMILADLLILYYYKDKIIEAGQTLTKGISTRFKYKWWVYLLLPLTGFLMDFVFGSVTYPIKLILEWFGK